MGGGDPEALLIVAVSARALAEAARRAAGLGGRRILALDAFADLDLIAVADRAEAVPMRRRGGFAERPLIAAARRIAPVGSLFIAGSGFESRLALLARLAAEHRLAGNPPAVLARVKDPAQFFPALRRLGIAHPRVARSVPSDPNDWLIKRVGGAGGGHIRAARRSGPVPAGCYAQRRITGRAVSLAFLADGRRIAPVGFTQQWASPGRRSQFRYGGAACPAEVPRAAAESIMDAAAALVPEFGLRGLISADFLLHEERVWLLEINPRPGATLDILDRVRPGLLGAHVEASFGHLRLPPAVNGPARASAILFADRGPVPIRLRDWPDWVADRPRAGSTIPANGPICTVFGEGATATAARRSTEERTAALLEMLAEPVRMRL